MTFTRFSDFRKVLSLLVLFAVLGILVASGL